MRADDERDPLDSWLNQQVRPLPPPPGTFELITRRARGRKLRKLAVTVVSAAAVAAAVAVAVPVGLNLHLTQPPTKGAPIADSTSQSITPSRSSDGSATPINSPSPSPPATTTNPATEPSGTVPPGPVPPNFQPSSVTFVSGTAAWVIGQAGTPGLCADKNPDICTSIARTNDTGQSWVGSPAPKTLGPNGAAGVSGIRFLNGTDGWAFGPELWSTHDGGATWNQVNTHGARVTDLETSDGQAYALFATCATPANIASPSFAQDCTSYTLKATTAGSDDWLPVGGATTGLTDGGAATSAVLALSGSNGYLLAPDATLYSGSIGGTWSKAGTAPCKPGTAEANGLPQAAQFALGTPTDLYIACNQPAATDLPSLWASDNSGAHWTQLPAAQWSNFSSSTVNGTGIGIATSLAAAPGPTGNLTMATTTGIYVLSDASERWSASNATGAGAPSGGFSYVGMTTDTQGVALPANTSLGEIWITVDGGATWKPEPVK